jgi:hypothetical protein
MNKFTVIKNSDLTEEQHWVLANIVREIAKRQEEGRQFNNHYLVINLDEPYADDVKEIMKNNGHWE